jgi:hypothetical protein
LFPGTFSQSSRWPVAHDMDPTSRLIQSMVAKAHEAFSLAVSFWNTSLHPQLLALQDAVSKTCEAYPRVHSPYWDRILSTVVRLWDLYAPKVLEVLVGVIPPLFISVPLLLLSAPVRCSPEEPFDNLLEC